MHTCDRCGKQSYGHIMSMFNTDEICLECKEKERQHPRYAEAVLADEAQIRQGNYNFGGIGYPPPRRK